MKMSREQVSQNNRCGEIQVWILRHVCIQTHSCTEIKRVIFDEMWILLERDRVSIFKVIVGLKSYCGWLWQMQNLRRAGLSKIEMNARTQMALTLVNSFVIILLVYVHIDTSDPTFRQYSSDRFGGERGEEGGAGGGRADRTKSSFSILYYFVLLMYWVFFRNTFG